VKAWEGQPEPPFPSQGLFLSPGAVPPPPGGSGLPRSADRRPAGAVLRGAPG